MAVDNAEVIALRAKWDQVDAWVRDLEEDGESLPLARLYLAETKALLDFAEEMDDAA